MTDKTQRIVYGINSVRQAIKTKNNTCFKLVIPQGGLNSRLQDLVRLAQESHIRIEKLPKEVFQKKYRRILQNQGAVGYFSPKATMNLGDLITEAFQKKSRPVLAALDGIQDPQNLGAIIRSAEVLGLQGIIIPKRRASPLNETVAKCSSGAIELISVATVDNMAASLEVLKSSGFWVVGVTPDGDQFCHQFQFDMPTVLLIGGEGKGIRPVLRKKCDFTVAIAMEGGTGSLNVSVASAIVFHQTLFGFQIRGKA